jgi:two-component system sensor histidine kinase KdpD
MDLDAVLARRPAVAVVDELAHTNAPGSRHARRFQDVLELVEAGIGVYTTLNIQHLESLNDVVAQITGVAVRETVPDSILDEADEIELIDLPIEELLQRLAEGKVYMPQQAAQAIRRFFRAGNLGALRELALRRTAERVDVDLRAYMEMHAIVGPWPAGERLLVCVSPSPLSERLVRATRRLAARLMGEWYAVYVETEAHARLSPDDRQRVAQTLHLAEELGAKALSLPGESVAETVIAYAASHNVTKIVAGKPLQPRWRELLHGSVVDQIIRASGNIDIFVITASDEPARLAPRPAPPAPPRRWQPIFAAVALVGLATLAGLPLRTVIEPANLVMVYLLAVVVAAVRLGRGPAILASLLSVVAFDWFMVPPFHMLRIADAQYLLTFAGLLAVGLVTSTLASQAREHAQTTQRRARQTLALYELSRDLAAAGDVAEVTQVVVRHVEQLLAPAAAVLVLDGDQLKASSASAGLELSAAELAVATWTFQHKTPAGRGSGTLSGASGHYLPLTTAQGTVGVLGILQAEEMSAEQQRLAQSFASQAALAIERSQLAETASAAQLLQETERLQSALLNSISHNLRTPLASITGALSSLRDQRDLLDEQASLALVDTAFGEAERLNRLVGNLLDMTRMEAGALRLSLQPGDIQDAVGVAFSQLDQNLRGRPVIVDLPADLPLVPMDFALIVQVLVNLLDNANKYSPEGAPIEIHAATRGAELIVEIHDCGPGIPESEIESIFEKFHRVQLPGDPGGTGLGLSISRGIISAHGGRITARNRPEGGAVLSFSLPLAEGKAA